MECLQLGRAFRGEDLLERADLLRTDQPLDGAHAGGGTGRQPGRQRRNFGIELSRVGNLVHQTDRQGPRGVDRLAGEQESQRGADADQAGEGEGGAAIGDQAHASERRGKAGIARRHPEVAGQRQIETEPGRRAFDHGQHRHRTAHHGQHGGLEVRQPALQVGDRGDLAEPAQPMEVETGGEVPGGAAQHYQLGLAGIFDLVQRAGQCAGQRGSEGVAAAGPIERETVQGSVGVGQQLVGHWSTLGKAREPSAGTDGRV